MLAETSHLSHTLKSARFRDAPPELFDFIGANKRIMKIADRAEEILPKF